MVSGIKAFKRGLNKFHPQNSIPSVFRMDITDALVNPIVMTGDAILYCYYCRYAYNLHQGQSALAKLHGMSAKSCHSSPFNTESYSLLQSLLLEARRS